MARGVIEGLWLTAYNGWERLATDSHRVQDGASLVKTVTCRHMQVMDVHAQAQGQIGEGK